jgi:hypothetical protein
MFFHAARCMLQFLEKTSPAKGLSMPSTHAAVTLHYAAK